MIDVNVKPRADGKYDIYATETLNSEPLVNSSQGYENRDDAVATVRKLFGCDAALKLAEIRKLIEDTRDGTPIEMLLQIQRIIGDQPERIDLVVWSADSKTQLAERIR